MTKYIISSHALCVDSAYPIKIGLVGPDNKDWSKTTQEIADNVYPGWNWGINFIARTSNNSRIDRYVFEVADLTYMEIHDDENLPLSLLEFGGYIGKGNLYVVADKDLPCLPLLKNCAAMHDMSNHLCTDPNQALERFIDKFNSKFSEQALKRDKEIRDLRIKKINIEARHNPEYWRQKK